MKTLHLIERISHGSGGAGTKVTRMLVVVLLTSRTCYRFSCFDLTQAQTKQLEVLHRASMRVIMGLPRHARIEELHHFSQPPAIGATIEERRHNHSRRRTWTLSGQCLLLLDSPVHHTGLQNIPPKIPPWEDENVCQLSPTTQKLIKESHAFQQSACAGAMPILGPFSRRLPGILPPTVHALLFTTPNVTCTVAWC